MSKAVTRVAFLGPEGTFSHAATERFFGDQLTLLPVSAIEDVFQAVESGYASHGVVPVENSTEGPVNNTLDCLVDTPLQITGEIHEPIAHHFLVKNPESSSGLKQVVSHKQSLAQCRQWLKKHHPGLKQLDVSSNAEAARMAAADETVAAIAGQRAADTYGLQAVARNIQDRSNNTTRFLVLADARSPAPSGHDKTSILVYTENKPGALFRVLEPFNTHQVSLTHIETRPARDGIWAYVFFIDFEGHAQDAAVTQVLEELTGRAEKVIVLGSYPAGQSPETQTKNR